MFRVAILNCLLLVGVGGCTVVTVPPGATVRLDKEQQSYPAASVPVPPPEIPPFARAMVTQEERTRFVTDCKNATRLSLATKIARYCECMADKLPIYNSQEDLADTTLRNAGLPSS